MSSTCSLKSLLLEGFTDRVHNEGSRMPLKISLSPSIATKWPPALRQAWIEALAENQGRCKQKNKNKQSQGHNREVIKKLYTCAIKNYVANLCGGLNEQLEKEGSFSLPPLQGVLPLMS
jgi:hypothetical protein